MRRKKCFTQESLDFMERILINSGTGALHPLLFSLLLFFLQADPFVPPFLPAPPPIFSHTHTHLYDTSSIDPTN